MNKKCQGKNRYPDKLRAELVKTIRQHNSFYTLRTYLCPKCKGWHLTSQPKKENQSW